MITRFFNDIIFREEDVLQNRTLLPGDRLNLSYFATECTEVFIVRVGEEIKEEGE